MQANSTTAMTITQAQATTTETGPTWTTKEPAMRSPWPRRPATRWIAEDAVYNVEAYKAWLQRLDSDHWQEIYGAHTPAEFARALQDCRYYKNARQQFDAAGQPARWTARLKEVRQQMQATLQALQFESPATLWREYQWSQYRDPDGYSPDHAAHIAEVDHYLWLREVSQVIPLDNNDGGYSSPYVNNVDAALEADRTPQLDYAVTDDADNPTYQLATLHRQLGHANRKRKALFARIKATTDPQAQHRLTARYNMVAAEIKRLAAEADELSRLLTPPNNEDGEYEISPDQWARQIAYRAADYGLTRSTPAAPGTQSVDVFNRAAEATDAIQNLLDLQRQSRDLIAYIDSRKATGKEITPTQARMYAEAQELLPVITASLAAQTARLHA